MPSTREKLHASLRKLRDVYRAGVKRGRYKAEIAEYNARLGLRADDSTSFREFLQQHDLIREASRNVRGRSGDSCSHVLITLK